MPHHHKPTIRAACTARLANDKTKVPYLGRWRSAVSLVSLYGGIYPSAADDLTLNGALLRYTTPRRIVLRRAQRVAVRHGGEDQVRPRLPERCQPGSMGVLSGLWPPYKPARMAAPFGRPYRGPGRPPTEGPA